jgi:hypothetical protein
MIGGGKVLHIEEQHTVASVWTEEEVDAEGQANRTREVVFVGTGHEIPESHPYHLGTYLSMNGAFVWHIYGNVDRGGLQPERPF